MAPFLEIITRTCHRPRLLARNQASLATQSDPDFLQALIIDDVGRGVNWANANLAEQAGKLWGEYIWILDDDDLCTRQSLVRELKAISRQHQPDVIMMRMDHGERGILPDDSVWGKPPQHGRIGVSAYVVRREIWQQHASAWRSGVYHSDFDFIAAIFAAKPSVYWHNVIASQVQQIGRGQSEKGLMMARKVKALKSFAGTDPSGVKHRIAAGDEFDLPEGVDWLDAGLVVLLEPETPPAVISPQKSKRGTK